MLSGEYKATIEKYQLTKTSCHSIAEKIISRPRETRIDYTNFINDQELNEAYKNIITKQLKSSRGEIIDDVLCTISTSISQKSSASLGNLIPMLPNMFDVGPAVPCCELYDSIRFLTMFRSTLTGRKSSSSSSMSSLFCLGILDGAGPPPVFVFCVGSAVCGLDCFFFLGGGFGLSMEFYEKRFNRIIILAQHDMQMICRWYADDMQMICKWYANDMHYADDMQMICRWYADDMQMICKWYANDMHYADDMQMICRWYADDMQMICRWYADDMQIWYADDMQMI